MKICFTKKFVTLQFVLMALCVNDIRIFMGFLFILFTEFCLIRHSAINFRQNSVFAANEVAKQSLIPYLVPGTSSLRAEIQIFRLAQHRSYLIVPLCPGDIMQCIQNWYHDRITLVSILASLQTHRGFKTGPHCDNT